MDKMKRYEKALKLCSAVLKIEENNGEALANRADAYLSMEEFEKAKHDFKKAHDTDNQNQRVRFSLFFHVLSLFSLTIQLIRTVNSMLKDIARQRPC